MTSSVSILPAWEKGNAGDNRGSAGVAFGAEDHRGAGGGEAARNLQIRAQ